MKPNRIKNAISVIKMKSKTYLKKGLGKGSECVLLDSLVKTLNVATNREIVSIVSVIAELLIGRERQ